MTDTLSYKDVVQRTGYTVIENVRVVQYVCTIPIDNPKDMRIGITRLDQAMYKANRDTCRADYAEFEDAAYELQEELLAKISG